LEGRKDRKERKRIEERGNRKEERAGREERTEGRPGEISCAVTSSISLGKKVRG